MTQFLLLLVLFILSKSAQASASASASASTAVTSAPAARSAHAIGSSNATCPYRTINYITHSLPQQCLTSTRRSSNNSSSSVTGGNLTEHTVVETASENHSTAPSAPSLPITATSESITDAIPTSTSQVEEPTASPSSAEPPPSYGYTASTEPEEPSPLEGDKFMSFDQWKRQNLQKIGQSEHIGRDNTEPQAPRKRPVNIHNALDSLGDDTEIDLDFSGFIPDSPEPAATPVNGQDARVQHTRPDTASTPGVRSRSKDAGTTCKERFNYASFDCAANILKSNKEATSAGAVLGENKDSYMLNVCSAENKFLILELCDDISIDTIVLANFEFFSSIFRTFRVSVSDKYPVKVDKWKTIGTFEARNTRDVQAFLVENPIIWARYVRFEFLTHYGNEYYCPVSLVRIHGTTMLEEYKRDAESLLASEDDDEAEATEDIAAQGETLVPEAIAAPILEEKQEQLSKQIEQQESFSAALNDTSTESTDVQSIPTTDVNRSPALATASATQAGGTSKAQDIQSGLLASEPVTETCYISEVSSPGKTSSALVADPTYTSNTTSATSSSSQTNNANSTISANVSILPDSRSSNATKLSQSAVDTASNKTAVNGTSSERQKPLATSTQSQPAVPTMQESFFKSVQKRLQTLEANSSLSLQYIEDQSRALRDAFNKVEQRQLAKTTTFLEYLNTTVLNELREFRQQYDQLWQSTVIELEMQRERYQQENSAINARLGILADELIFQKRISILQMVLILICLALVLFAKGMLNQYLEIPVVQRVLARSPSNRWLGLSNLDTPTQSPPATRDGEHAFRKRQGILKGHRRMHSEDSIEDPMSPDGVYPSPPTPTSMSYGETSDGEHVKEDKPLLLEDPEFDPSTIQRPSTSPPILPSEVPSSPEFNGVLADTTIDSRLELGITSPPASPEPQSRGLPASTSLPVSLPQLTVEAATPERTGKQLSWKLPDS